MADFYETLGVKKDASTAEIKSAFKAGAKQHHPDRNGGKPSEKFHQLVRAYDTLKDDKTRDHYDRTGQAKEGTAIDPVEDMARSLIGMIMSELMDRADLLSINLPKLLIEKIREAREQLKQGDKAAADVETKLKRLQKARAKLKTGVKDAMVTSIMDAKIDALRRSQEGILSEVKRSREAVDRAAEIVRSGEYLYDPDPPDPLAQQAMDIQSLDGLFEALLKSQRKR